MLLLRDIKSTLPWLIEYSKKIWLKPGAPHSTYVFLEYGPLIPTDKLK